MTIYKALLTSIALATSVFSPTTYVTFSNPCRMTLLHCDPMTPFLPPGADFTIPDAYIIDVAKSLSRVKTDIAVGPDGTPNWILHDYATVLAPPVCAIFNSSLREGTVPMLWKCADIRPIHRVRPPTLIHKDLRPISNNTGLIIEVHGEINL